MIDDRRRRLPALLDRRAILALLAATCPAAALSPAATSRSTTDALVDAIGLEPGERAWLTELSAAERQELYEALVKAHDLPVAPRMLDLLTRILGPRSRLFAFVDYPAVADIRSVCDGLLRE